MSTADLSVELGRVRLKNPLICGSGEHTMSADGITAAIDAGAGAVVAKSINESQAAKDQLLRADYALYDSNWRRLPWNFAPPSDATLFCRSGLSRQSFRDWLDMVSQADRLARGRDAFVVASLIPSSMEIALDHARQVEAAGIRILEVNIGAPHGEEAAAGSIMNQTEDVHVEAVTRQFRDAVDIPLWIKLTGRSGAIDSLAAAARNGGADAVTVMGRFMAFLPDVDTLGPALSTRAAIGGGWALPLACDWLQKSRQRLGPGFPLIGTNGARSGLDIARFMLAGAFAVQMTTAVFTGGYDKIGAAIEELERFLSDKGMDAEGLIGLAADQVESYQDQPEDPDHLEAFLPTGKGS